MELIEWIYEELVTDAKDALVNELIERFRPESARTELTNSFNGQPPDDLLDVLQAFRQRQAARLSETLSPTRSVRLAARPLSTCGNNSANDSTSTSTVNSRWLAVKTCTPPQSQ